VPPDPPLTANARRRPDRDALVVGDERLSWAELSARAVPAAAGLAERGVQAGDRVAVLLPAGIDFAVTRTRSPSPPPPAWTASSPSAAGPRSTRRRSSRS
jgi:non-ribosomal peptide synthetase component F